MANEREPSGQDQRHQRLSASAFAALFARSHRVLWCVAASVMGDRSTADDVLQEAAMVGLNKLNEFEIGTNFTAWMSRIVRFTAMNFGRKHAHRPTPVDPHEVLDTRSSGSAAVKMAVGHGPAVGGNGQLTPDQDDFDDDVRNALGRLDETARACLLMRTVLELPYRDIALALDIPEGTAMSHVHRSRRMMWTLLRSSVKSTASDAESATRAETRGAHALRDADTTTGDRRP